MSKAIVSSLFSKSSQIRKLRDRIAQTQTTTYLSNLAGAAAALVIADFTLLHATKS